MVVAAIGWRDIA